MKLLILGGTVFLGRHIAEEALRRGHAVTLFHRGEHGRDLFPEAEHVWGDRNQSLDALHDRAWDIAVDTSAFFPRQVQEAAHTLAGNARRYMLVSTISVYADEATIGQDETASVGTLADPNVETVTGETYGPLKALCETAALEGFGDAATIVRPGLIVGPWDPTDRFTYWPVRMRAGGDVLCPGDPAQLTQFIDVRDLATWILDLAEAGRAGTFNATGPEQPLAMETLLEKCREVAGPDARLHWVDERYLLERGIAPFTELPCWVPAEAAGLMQISNNAAVRAGLRFRPLETTIRDTLEWASARSADYQWKNGLDREREAQILAARRSG